MRTSSDLDGDAAPLVTPVPGGGGTGVAGPVMRFTSRARGRTPGLTRERNGLLRAVPRSTIGRRTLSLLCVYLLVIGAIVLRLGQVQVVEADEYAAKGAAQRERSVTLAARRGRLYDRDGNVLALSVDSATVYADPASFLADPDLAPDEQPPTPREVATRLAPLLGADVDELTRRMTGDRRFAYLARQVDWEVGEQVRALDLHGVGVLVEPRRTYPAGPLGAQVLGFTDIDGIGRSGLEDSYDELLRGTPGRLAVERAGTGGLSIASGPRQISPATPGTDLVLTLDREIQDVAQRAAADAVAQYSARSASVVVLDVASGDVLAMATAPAFDPAAPGDADPATWRNRSVTDVFEPGSVMKAVTAAAALEEGVVRPESLLLVPDSIDHGGATFTDSHSHDPEVLRFEEVIEQSSNVGTIQVAERLGEERLAAWMSAFGIGRAPGVDFPGESAGLLPAVDDWWQTSLPTISIGHGVATSLLQLATVYATIANDGVAVEPRLVRGTVGEDGRLSPTSEGARRTVVRKETAEQLQVMLSRVVEGEKGTGRRAAVEDYRVAGKTGTARKPRENGIGYSGKYAASFVGFGPVEDPQLVVAVTVDEPYPIYGGVVAAPVFSEVMTFALPHRRVPPSPAAPPAPDEGALGTPLETTGGVGPTGDGDGE